MGDLYVWKYMYKRYMSNNLIISAEYSAPPSEIYAFRTLTMYASVFKGYECVVEVTNWEEVDRYYKWLKGNYIYDYIKDMVNQLEGNEF